MMKPISTKDKGQGKTPSKRGKVYPANIPDPLKKLDQWACWRHTTKDGRTTKPPYDPRTGRFAKVDDPSTWVSYEEALEAFRTGEYDGLSFFLSPDNEIVGIDLDDCRNPKNNRIAKWAIEILHSLDTYSEVSPSGTGVRGFLCGKLPPAGRRKGKIEVYDQSKALTVTGRMLKDFPATINDRTDELLDFHARHIGTKDATEATRKTDKFTIRPDVEPDPAKVKALCRQFTKAKPLTAGDYSAYSSPSDAEQALANYAAGAGWSDQAIVDVLVHARLNHGEEPKASTYYEATVGKALSSDLAKRGQKPKPTTTKRNAPKPLRRVLPVARSLVEVKETFHRYLHLEDDSVIDLVLSLAVGTKLLGNPIWLYLIGPASCGKTEILNTIRDRDDTFWISDFNDKALVSHWKDPEHPDKEVSLLPEMNNKLVIVPDWTTILALPSETRSRFYGVLRSAYDGSYRRSSGIGTTEFHSRFNMVGATTPEVESDWDVNNKLGERFLAYRMNVKDRTAHMRKALHHINGGADFQDRLKEVVQDFLTTVPDYQPSIAPIEESILNLAEFVATTRSAIERDRTDGAKDFAVELPTRIFKQLIRIAQSLALVRHKKEASHDEFTVLRKIAMDSIRSRRSQVIRELMNRPLKRSLKALQDTGTLRGVSTQTLRRTLKDLVTLGVLDSSKRGNKDYFQISSSTRDRLKIIKTGSD